jgi:hypothetical protein
MATTCSVREPSPWRNVGVEAEARKPDVTICPDCGDEPVVEDGQKCAGCLALDVEEREFKCPQCRTSVVEAEGVLCSDQCEAEAQRDVDADRRVTEALDQAGHADGEER